MASTVGETTEKFLSTILDAHPHNSVDCISVKRRVLSKLSRVPIVFNTWIFQISTKSKFFEALDIDTLLIIGVEDVSDLVYPIP